MFAAFILSAVPGMALAYIGPGAGLSAIGGVVSLLGAVVLLIVGFVWYPVKRLLRRRHSVAGTPDDLHPDEK
jgi:uncharacterized membrane protein YdjX (TVP38/TMEM64 family)